MFVCFSKPIGLIPAREPIRVAEDTKDVLKMAARMGLRPERVWEDGNTIHVRSNDRRRRGFAPVYR